MFKFNVGDRVKCIKAKGAEWGMEHLENDKIYTIKRVDTLEGCLYLEEIAPAYGWFANRFELFAGAFKVGDILSNNQSPKFKYTIKKIHNIDSSGVTADVYSHSYEKMYNDETILYKHYTVIGSAGAVNTSGLQEIKDKVLAIKKQSYIRAVDNATLEAYTDVLKSVFGIIVTVGQEVITKNTIKFSDEMEAHNV